MDALNITSPAFTNDGKMPAKYSCEGDGINPPLEIAGVPEGTQSLALIAEDPDAPNGAFCHWVVWNIDATTRTIKEGHNPGISGSNGHGKTGYAPACPPDGAHHYYFWIYALDKELDLEPGSDVEALREAMSGHVLAEGELVGIYEKRGI